MTGTELSTFTSSFSTITHNQSEILLLSNKKVRTKFEKLKRGILNEGLKSEEIN